MTQSAKKTSVLDGSQKSGIMYYNGQYSDVITPLMVDLNEIFDDKLTLSLSHYVKKDTKVAVNIGTNSKMHQVTGTIVSIKEKGVFFEAIMMIDFIPDGLVKDLEELLTLESLGIEEGWE